MDTTIPSIITTGQAAVRLNVPFSRVQAAIAALEAKGVDFLRLGNLRMIDPPTFAKIKAAIATEAAIAA